MRTLTFTEHTGLINLLSSFNWTLSKSLPGSAGQTLEKHAAFIMRSTVSVWLGQSGLYIRLWWGDGLQSVCLGEKLGTSYLAWSSQETWNHSRCFKQSEFNIGNWLLGGRTPNRNQWGSQSLVTVRNHDTSKVRGKTGRGDVPRVHKPALTAGKRSFGGGYSERAGATEGGVGATEETQLLPETRERMQNTLSCPLLQPSSLAPVPSIGHTYPGARRQQTLGNVVSCHL